MKNSEVVKNTEEKVCRFDNSFKKEGRKDDVVVEEFIRLEEEKKKIFEDSVGVMRSSDLELKYDLIFLNNAVLVVFL